MILKIYLNNIILVILLALNLHSHEFKGNIGVEVKKYEYKLPVLQDKISKAIYADIEIKEFYSDFVGFIKVESLKDKDNKKRKYIKLNEAYIKYEGESFDVKIGRDIKYWGALEINNITDIYNKKNVLNDIFDKDKKLGTFGITYTKYFENEDELSLIITDKKDKYIKYSGSRDDVDFSLFIQNDEKIATYETIVKDTNIFKIEALYDRKIKKYNFGLGIEHTLYGFWGVRDLGLLSEYYKSNNAISVFKNDIFIGARLTFNDASSSEFITGVINNNDNANKSYTLEYTTRFYDDFKIKVNYLHSNILELTSLDVGYYF